MKILNVIKRKIKWHFWPAAKNFPILSVYELTLYLLACAVCIGIYILINQVPYHKDTFNVELIHRAKGDSLSVPYMEISYYIPNSYTFEKNEGKGRIMFITTNKRIDNNKDSSNVYFSDTYFDIDKIYLYRNLETYKQTNNRDSLYNFFLSKIPDSLDAKQLPSVFYVKVSQENTLYKYILHFATKPWEGIAALPAYYAGGQLYEKDDCYISETMATSGAMMDINDAIAGVLSRPSWYSPFDISQSYFNIRINSPQPGGIKGGRLSFYFEGAADFSKMYPEPDDITMNSIHFVDPVKIQEIKLNGLLFHVKFPELENIQDVRIFFVSATIGGLIIIFITFFILSSYRVLFKKKLKEQHQIAELQNYGDRFSDTQK